MNSRIQKSTIADEAAITTKVSNFFKYEYAAIASTMARVNILKKNDLSVMFLSDSFFCSEMALSLFF